MVTRYRTPNKLYMCKMKFILHTSLIVFISCFGISTLNAQMGCMLTITLQADCNDNGTPCDFTDDWYEVFAFGSNGGNQGFFSAETATGVFGPWPYDAFPLSLGIYQADQSGPQVCAVYTDSNDPQCRVRLCTEPLVPCSDTFVWFEVFEYVCDDNRTANDVSDDFYTITLVGRPPAAPWNHNFEIHANGQVFGGLSYNNIEEIILPADGSYPALSMLDEHDLFCDNVNTIGPLDPCSQPCAMNPQVIDWVCDDNGSPTPKDDIYIVTLTANAVTGSFENMFTVKSNLLPALPFAYGGIYQLVLPARGQYETLIFSDSYYTDCNAEIEIGPLDPCSVLCDTEVDSLTYICDDNGTQDPTDDFYIVTMVVNDTAAGSGYIVQIGGDQYGPFDYGEIEQITLPADGSEPRLNFRDVDFPTCNTFRIIGPLEPCSFPCDLLVNSLIPTCNDNGTTDPSDDYYEITINVDYLQATASDSFIVEMDGNIYGNFAYNEDNVYTFPADGGTYELLIQDLLRGTSCEMLDTIGPLEPCSSICELDISVTNIVCNDSRTGLDPNDDTFSFEVSVNGVNVGANWRLNNPAMSTAPYGSSISVGPYLISGGNVTLTVTDVSDPYCRETFTVNPPPTCSDSCFIEVLDFEIGPCDDNNTGENENDDFFFVDLLVDGQNVSSAGTYVVIVGGMQLGPYTYGVREMVGPLPANGANVVLIIRDSETDYCEARLVVSQESCSDCSDIADAGGDKLITCQDNEVTLDGSGSSPGTYNWVGPGGRQYTGQNPRVGEPGVYVLTITFAKGCTSVDSVRVDRSTDLPISDPGANAELTCIVDSVLVGGPNSSTGTDIIYEWRDINNNIISDLPSFMVGEPGTYCLKVIDTLLDCESAINCVEIGENRDAPQGNILVDPDDAFDCRIDSILLGLDDPENTKWVWEKNTVTYNTDTLWVTDTGVVYVILTDTISGCTTKLDIMINSLVDYPVISLPRPDTITCMRETVTIDGSNSQSGPTIFYLWYTINNVSINGATGRTLNVMEPGRYIFEATDTATGCVNRDTIVVPENRFYHNADAGKDQIIKCDSLTTFLNAGQSTQMNDISYSWSGLGVGGIVRGQGTLYPEVDGKGHFVLTVRDDISGCESYDTVYVDRVFPPNIDFLTVKGERCGGDESGSIDIAGISGIRPFTYELNGYSVTETKFDSLKPGLFFFRVTDSLGCKTDTLLEVTEGNHLDYQIQGDTFIFRGDSTTLAVTSTLPDDQVDQVYWSEDGSVFCFRCYEITVKPDTTTTYTFRLIDINGCELEFEFVVKVQDNNQVFVPNVFTPNEDTENEVLHVFGKHLVRIDRMMIFNRWGELVFQNFNMPPGPVWDGRWNGEYHAPAVLTYVLDATFEDGQQKQFTGSVTLLR